MAQAVDTVAGKASRLSYQNWEIYPVFLKGSLDDYINSKFKTPKELKTAPKDTAVIDIQLDSAGKVNHILMLKNVSTEITDQLTRILANTKWKPAIYNFEPVGLDMVLEVAIAKDSLNGNLIVKTGQYHPKANLMPIHPPPVNTAGNGFTPVEQTPSFPGGFEAFSRYLAQNIRYPKKAVAKNIQGKVFVAFMVEKDGQLTEFHVMRSPSDDLSFEALRVLKAAPNFNPGIQNGKPVRVAFIVPISFTL